MENNGTKVVGIGFIAVGVLSLLISKGFIDIHPWEFWPFIILIFGIAFELAHFLGKDNNPGLLVPAGIFITIGILFVICVLYGWGNMERLWPLIIMAPGIGLLQLNLFGERNSGTIVPAAIILVVGGYFLVNTIFIFSSSFFVFSIVLITIGIMLILPKGAQNINNRN